MKSVEFGLTVNINGGVKKGSIASAVCGISAQRDVMDQRVGWRALCAREHVLRATAAQRAHQTVNPPRVKEWGTTAQSPPAAQDRLCRQGISRSLRMLKQNLGTTLRSAQRGFTAQMESNELALLVFMAIRQVSRVRSVLVAAYRGIFVLRDPQSRGHVLIMNH